MTRQLIILITGLMLAAGTAGAVEQQTFILHSEDGANQQVLLREGGEALIPAIPELLRDEVLWQHFTSPSIYASVDVSAATLDVIAGAENGPPIGVELLALDGDGTPAWTVPGGAALAQGAKEADVFASVVPTAGNTAALVSGYGADSSTPRWTHTEPNCAVQTNSLAVSRFGSVVAVGLSQQPSTLPSLLCFDGVTGTLLSNFKGAAGLQPRAVVLSDDGSLAAMRASYMVYVIETATGTLRWSGNVSASADALTLSGDGEWLATGWQSLVVYQWNGSVYQLRWTQAGGTYFLGRCALSSDGGTLISGWYSSSFLRNKVILHDPASSTPVWTYLYTQASGGYQDIPAGVDVTADGAWAVVGSWGDQYSINPEVHVFARAQAEPVFTVDTPGSVWDAAIVGDGSGGAYACAGGKHVHSNQMGNSGDLYAIHIDGPTAAPPATPALGLTLAAWPNPFNPHCTLQFALATEGHVRLEIFDAEGRLVRRLLDGALPEGPQVVIWDGRSDAGNESASGVYLARLAAAGEAATQTLVLLR